MNARSGSITNEWKNRWGTIELSAQTSVSFDVSGVGAAALSDEVVAGASEEGAVTEVAVVAVVEVVEVTAPDWLAVASTVVVIVTAPSAEEPDPPDEHPATHNAPAASNEVNRPMVAAR